jgi:ankyrin repeat protein
VEFLLDEKGIGHLVNSLNANGKTPLLKALKIDNHNAVELLLKHGANPDVAHPNGSTPLMMAVHCQLPDSVELLIQAGASVNAHDARGSTALHSATYMSKTDAVRMLLEAGAEPNVQNVDHETPLHTAMGPDPAGTVCTETYDQKNVVTLLLMAHADRSIKTNIGDTAFDRAKRYGHFERAYLLETGNPEVFSGPPPSHVSWRKFLYVHYTGNVEIPDWYHSNESSYDEADDNEADHDEGITDSDENLGEDSDEAGDEGSEEDWDENEDWDGDEDLHGDGEDMADADAEMLDV